MVIDALTDTVGGILMQDQVEDLEPMAFMSRALNLTEQRYSAYERELVAIVYCCIQLQHC